MINLYSRTSSSSSHRAFPFHPHFIPFPPFSYLKSVLTSSSSSLSVHIMSNWVHLPQDLLETISDISSLPDQIRMQSVCKSWRSTLKNSIRPELPWLMMLPKSKQEEEEDPDARDFFSLSKQKIHTIRLPDMRGKRCCGSFNNGWLMTLDKNLDFHLFHPWSKTQLPLPRQSTLNAVDHSLSRIWKAALSDDGNMLLVIHSHGHLGLFKIDDKVWTRIHSAGWMQDVVYHKGHFYAFCPMKGLYRLRIEDGFFSRSIRLTENFETSGLVYLVPDILTENMFVIDRELEHLYATDDEEGDPIGKTIRFDIYWTPLARGAPKGELNKLEKVESLGDRMLFLGYNSPMIFMASEFPGFKGNRIYFADRCAECYYHCPCGCCVSGVFNVEDGTVEQLSEERFCPASSPLVWIATPPYSLERDFGEMLCLE